MPAEQAIDRCRDGADVWSRQVNWWSVHEFVVPLLDRAGAWPMAGTPAWCVLGDDDPVKIAALYDAARHHALHVDTAQAALANTSRDISAAADWARIAREIRNRRAVYIPRRRSDVA